MNTMSAPLSHCRILVAEDERHVRMLLRVVLEAAGATVVDAEDGTRAMRLLDLDADGFDLLLTDLNMPDLDGPTLVEAVRLRWPRMPVVVCSARSLRAMAPHLVPVVQATVTKPFVPSDLVRAVATALATPAERFAAV